MREYGFSSTRILPYKDKIYDFVFIWENTGQWKPVLSQIFCSESLYKHNTNLIFARYFSLVKEKVSTKGHPYINKPETERCRFVCISMTF